MEKLKVGIAGGAGYTGGELIRILINHPGVEIAFVNSKSNAGNRISKVHGDLEGETELTFTGELSNDIDVLFLCVGHGEAKKFLSGHDIDKKVRVIDLSQDFRLKENSVFDGREFVYGLPELNREQIKGAQNVANPGCFATSIELGLLPLAKAGLLTEVHATGITGSTGAGQSLTSSSHFSWRANNIQAYKTLSHQHIHEILQSLNQLQHGFSGGGDKVNFVPWRGDFTRGIFVSSQLDNEESIEDLISMYTEYYKDHPFVHVSRE